MAMARDDIVRASEIGSYAYCARAWWLRRVKGYQPANLQDIERGNAVHLTHGRSVARSSRWQRWAYFILILAAVSALFFIWQLVTM